MKYIYLRLCCYFYIIFVDKILFTCCYLIYLIFIRNSTYINIYYLDSRIDLRKLLMFNLMYCLFGNY